MNVLRVGQSLLMEKPVGLLGGLSLISSRRHISGALLNF